MVNNPAVKTLIYESIFKFPLYKEEVWTFLISDRKISKRIFEKFIKDPQIHFDKHTKLYGLSKNKQYYEERLDRIEISKNKEKVADRAISLLSKIPTIELIGISGSLAQFSAEKDDDIDLFVLVRKNTVWTTRFFCVLILKFIRLYRSDKDHADKVCLNMISDEYSLDDSRRDLYDAFEISQLRPKLSRKKSYEKFIEANDWIKKFLPNADVKASNFEIVYRESSKLIKIIFKILGFLAFEKIASFLQLIYMKKRTNETVTNHFLAFHPRDFRLEIMRKYNGRIRSTRGH